MHRFHPQCIIPYFRTAGANGRCPECRRNPFAEENQEPTFLQNDLHDPFPPEADEDDEDDDDIYPAIRRIRELQELKAKRSRAPKVLSKKRSINHRLQVAREARQKAMEMRRKTMASRKFAKMKEDLQRHDKKQKEYREKWRKLQTEIWKIEGARSTSRRKMSQAKWSAAREHSVLGSQIDPQWQYLKDDGEWSDKKSSNEIRRLLSEINHETLIRHPELPRDVPLSEIEQNFRDREM